MVSHKAGNAMAAKTLARPVQDISAQAEFQLKAKQANERIDAVLRDLGLALQHQVKLEPGPDGWIKPVVITRYVPAKGK